MTAHDFDLALSALLIGGGIIRIVDIRKEL